MQTGTSSATRLTRSKRLLCVPVLALLWSAAPARANLVITPTFDSSITGLSNAAAVEAAINSQIAFYQNTFSNPINVGITFADVSSGLGESSFNLYGVSYSAFRAELAADSSGDTTDTTALAHLVAASNNPVTNEPTMLIKGANAKALGFTGLPASDGTISVNLSLTTIDGGSYSLASVVDHEIDEILGLGSTLGLGLPAPYNSDPSPEDLFRYDAFGGRSFSTSTACTRAAYFSLDGTTKLAQFNNCDNGGDYGDWATSGTPQVQDAFSTPGATPALTASSPEIVALDAVGYTLAPAAVPEPTTFAPLLLGLGALLRLRKK